ncbi:neuronal acetylcholine receptor subunit alpha-7-like [Vanacampus margaritifer]
MAPYEVLLVLLVSACTVQVSIQGPNEYRLFRKLMKDYINLERPVVNESQVLNVRVGIYLMQIMDLDEVNQVLTTSVWLQLSWIDYKLQWDASKYDGIDSLQFSNDRLWKPDVVLYNSALERFHTTYDAKVYVASSGSCLYQPQAILKSTCYSDLRWFPFDSQKCDLKFGSRTYSGLSLDLTMTEAHLSEYVPNGEWDLVGVTGKKNNRTYECFPEPYIDVTYTIVMRRRTLFYVVCLIIPCILISILALLVFLLPADSGEKISLGITVMLSLIVLMLLGAQMIPATSDSVPLIAQYVVITMAIVTLSVIVTVVVLKFHHHDPNGDKMPKWIRVVLFDWCGWFLHMKRPNEDKTHSNPNSMDLKARMESVGQAGEGEVLHSTAGSEPELVKILHEVRYIAKCFRDQQHGEATHSDWKFAAAVIDRLCFVIFLLFIILCTFMVLKSAPN